MSAVGEKVWLVAVTEEPAELEPGNPSITGHFLYASAEGAFDGLRDALDAFNAKIAERMTEGAQEHGDEDMSATYFTAAAKR